MYLFHTPNSNEAGLNMLAKAMYQKNRARNRILLCAIAIGILTLTIVFSISFGKGKAEYTKAIRQAGTTASTTLENGTETQYQQILSLSYVKKAGRKRTIGTAKSKEKTVCQLSMLDDSAWKDVIRPAYTDIHGHYPENAQELMLSTKALNALGIHKPQSGMEIPLTVSIGWTQTREETFTLCGWFTSYTDPDSQPEEGYLSAKKLSDWEIPSDEKMEILICPSDQSNWKTTETKLYRDVPRDSENQTFTVTNTAAYDVIHEMTGSYELALLGGLIVLCGIFSLIFNVMQISMAGDVRQIGLLNTLGATKKQLRRLYKKQFLFPLLSGSMLGTMVAVFVLLFVLPAILGQQYLQNYGTADEFSIFDPRILVAAILFTVLILELAAESNIAFILKRSCVQNLHYTGTTHTRKHRHSKRSDSFSGLLSIAWRNVTRQKHQFVLTILSISIGMEVLLCAVVIIGGSDISNRYTSRADFIIAGDFCEDAKKAGGFTFQPQEEQTDPFHTDGEAWDFMWNSYNDSFSPIPDSVKEEILSLDGVNWKQTVLAKGAYMIPVMSKKGWSPFANSDYLIPDGTNRTGQTEMLESGLAETIRILTQEELTALKKYASQKHLHLDLESVENGTGVLFLHEHCLTPEKEKAADQVIGEPVRFLKLMSQEEETEVKATSKSIDELGISYQPSEEFTLSGYLDNTAKDFPQIRLGWHGKNMPVFLVSEKGFKRLNEQKKTLYMELSVDAVKEEGIKNQIQTIIQTTNQERAAADTAKILILSKSDLLHKMSGIAHGNKMLLGSISILLLFAGLTNYFQVMLMGIYARKQEFQTMESIGMTRKQQRKMLFMEGFWYFLITEILLLTIGTGILLLVRSYMQKEVLYFTFRYPFGWIDVVTAGLLGVCLSVVFICEKVDFSKN